MTNDRMFLTINFFFLHHWKHPYDSLDKDPRKKKKKFQRIVNKPALAPRSYQLSHDTANTHNRKISDFLSLCLF